ncbi:unnamed protein product [Durusdinium trenchii]|uniref:Uncharacterized protein n=1 Tax=Durusdinium trenchii TaxID=1381693 RepID=A0ABP0LJ94_9DINO
MRVVWWVSGGVHHVIWTISIAAYIAQMALRVLWAASGESAAVFSDEELEALVKLNGNTIMVLKSELMSRGFGSRFQQRLFHMKEDAEVDDDAVLAPPMVLKMVKLTFLPPHQKRDEEFLVACKEGRLQEVETRLHQPQDPNCADAQGFTALHFAAANGMSDVVRILLEAGASCDRATSYEGITALHAAAANGKLDVVHLLLRARASSNTADAERKTALNVAAANGHPEVVHLLLDAGASSNTADAEGKTALDVAAANGRLEVVRLLLDAEASSNTPAGSVDFWGAVRARDGW